MSTTPSFRLLSSTMPTSFLVDVVSVYQSLKPISFTSFTFCPFYFISWTQRIFTRHLIMVPTTSRSLLISDLTFQVPIRTLLGSASFLTLCICRVICEDLYLFFTTPGRWCSASHNSIIAHLTLYPDQDIAHHQGDGNPTLTYLTLYPGSDMPHR
jgi:hypothetical protein